MHACDLSGAVVVITGASSGIGRCAALAFAREGALLVLAARDEEALEEVAEACRDLGTQALAVPTDVTLSESVEALASAAATFGGGYIDIWVNNAGVGAVGAFDETPIGAHERVVQTDLLGYLRGAHAVLPYFKQQRRGVLINTLSVGAWLAQPYAVAYSASKFGLEGFSRALRAELVDWPRIQVCDLYPAVVDTPGFRDGGNYTGHAIMPPPALTDPRKVAEAMVSLARRPRHATSVGPLATALRLGHFALPLFERLYGRLVGGALQRARRVPTSPGNLFHPALGQRRVDGGWREATHQQAWLGGLAAGAAVLLALAWYGRRCCRRGPRR